jgi:hypothetical protein
MSKNTIILTDKRLALLATAESVMRTAIKNTVKDDGKIGAAWASVGRATANDILDRVHGKATQRTEVTKQVVTLNIDLTSSM